MSDIDLKSTPHDKQAEEAALGSALIDGEVIEKSDLQPSDFYIERNRWVWNSIRKLQSAGREIDYLTVSQQIEADGHLSDLGGPAYLIELINQTPTSIHFEAYAATVREMAIRRQVLQVANELARGAYDRAKPVDQTITESMVKIPQLARVKSGAQHISYFAKRHFDRLEERQKNPLLLSGIPTGFDDYDDITGGLRKGELLLLMGKPGLGKTMWLLTAGFQMAEAGHPGSIYEMETSEEASMDREISRRGEILTDRIETGSMTSEDWTAYVNAIDALSREDLPAYLSFESGWTTASLRADLTRLKAERNIEWFVVDYLKFLNDVTGSDETERQNYISKQLKRICKDLDLAGAVIHSMNKAGLSSAIPDLNNMSQGADIAFDCDKAVFMVEHTPLDGSTANPDGRTFVFKKSRSKIKRTIFHMEKLRDFPAFRSMGAAKEADQPVDGGAQRRYKSTQAKQTTPPPEPDWNSNEDLEL